MPNPIKVRVFISAFCNAAGVDGATARLLATKFPESVVMQFSEADLVTDEVAGEAVETPALDPTPDADVPSDASGTTPGGVPADTSDPDAALQA